MWPFTKSKECPKSWLTESQAREVVRIFYRDHDSNCWYACARLPAQDDLRIAASSKEEARKLADALAEEIFLRTRRRLPAREE